MSKYIPGNQKHLSLDVFCREFELRNIVDGYFLRLGE